MILHPVTIVVCENCSRSQSFQMREVQILDSNAEIEV